MRKLLAVICLMAVSVAMVAQEYMVIQKTDNSVVKIDVSDVKEVFFQKETTLQVSPLTVMLEGTSGAVGEFSISSNGDWSISGVPSWMKASKTSGIGNAVITVESLTENNASDRSATLTVKAGSKTAKVVVTQKKVDAALLTVSPVDISLASASGSSASTTITCNRDWSISGVPSWLKVSETSGTGNVTITITAQSENTTSVVRPATITVTAAGKTAKINVKQDYTTSLAISPASVTLAATAGSTADATITCNRDWSISGVPSWLQASKTSGTGNATIVLTALNDNKSNEKRSATINVASGDKAVKLDVTQINDPETTLSVSPSSLTFEASANAQETVAITCNKAWSISGMPSWLKASATNGTGNMSVTFTTQSENTSTSDRSATLTINSSGKSATITVAQKGKPAGSLAAKLLEGNWFFDGKYISDNLLPYFEQAVAGSKEENEDINFMLLGTVNDIWGCAFVSGNYLGLLPMTYEDKGNAITLNLDIETLAAQDVTATSNGAYYYTKCNYNYVAYALAANNGKTWTLSSDDDTNPTWIELQSTGDYGKEIIRLFRDEVYLPFNNDPNHLKVINVSSPVTLCDGFGASLTFSADTKYYYAAPLEATTAAQYTDEEIAAVFVYGLEPTKLDGNTDLLISDGFQPSTDYVYFVLPAADTNGTVGKMERIKFTTKSSSTASDAIVNGLAYSGGKWSWNVSMNPKCSKYYMYAFEDDLANLFQQMPPIYTAVFLDMFISQGLPTYNQSGGYGMDSDATAFNPVTWGMSSSGALSGNISRAYKGTRAAAPAKSPKTQKVANTNIPFVPVTSVEKLPKEKMIKTFKKYDKATIIDKSKLSIK